MRLWMRFKQLIFTFAVAAIMMLVTTAPAHALELSRGVYRIPYDDGTEVRVGSDHNDHSPIGRIDMSGRGSSTYKIVAAAGGWIRFIEDSFSQAQPTSTRKPGDACNNNYVWIEHPNGEWTKYSHMSKDSATRKAGLSVGQWVNAGTYLGDEDDVGCANGNHLHFEVAVPRDTNPINPVGGFVNDNGGSERNRIPRICGISNGVFKTGTSYTAAWMPENYRRGLPEIARHGLSIEHYQCQFNQMVDAGYEPSWLDMFDDNGKTYVNVIGQRASGQGNAFHNLTGEQYQQRFEDLKKAGYKPVIVDSYLLNGQVRYAGFFKKGFGPDYAGYHGISAAEHQAKLDDWTEKGFFPTSISVVSVNGQRQYTGIYEKASLGSWQLKSQLKTSQYQETYDDNKEAGRHVAYLNGYKHAGESYLVAIFSSNVPQGGKYRHGLNGSQYQSEYESARSANLLTRIVTGYSEGGRKYAAAWR
ncbi:peptidoglycan DD-metalloendopeptidase family protein [Leptolyngbya ohadii]|uniref:peptidoglycan DD-metalloendopeptidase family protein n=1 Tax=Leptolyngbya ohadii TaxID=1962290 RepID=UPI000B59DA7A|nr:peptidoglycan DD-metalloendopeptidase family protein [Leptolyngbya ohadii]